MTDSFPELREILETVHIPTDTSCFLEPCHRLFTYGCGKKSLRSTSRTLRISNCSLCTLSNITSTQ
ncbi:hypothetical protein [Scytonema sp. NUACC26]|uniref:hypothetical protein n=1 Tax=Scytonema sp. NUACC26 TaxID=3140176 RepID=UPI0038B29A72